MQLTCATRDIKTRYNNLTRCINSAKRYTTSVTQRRSPSLKTARNGIKFYPRISPGSLSHLCRRCARLKSHLEYGNRVYSKHERKDWKNMGMISLSVPILQKPLKAFGFAPFLCIFLCNVSEHEIAYRYALLIR